MHPTVFWFVLALWATPALVGGSIPPPTPMPTVSCPVRCRCGLLTSLKSGRRLTTVDCAFVLAEPALAESLPPSTQALNLRGNSLRELPHLQPSLLELDICGNKIKALGRAKAFSKLPKLQELTLAKNQLSTLFSGAFQGLNELRSLSVSENRVAYIEEGALSGLPRLSRLDLSHNLLGSVYADWFRGLPSLTNLSLAHNRVHHLPARLFSGAPRLRSLDLSGNRLGAIDADAFASLTSLTTLLLQDNLLSSPPSSALSALINLQDLRLDKNPHQRLPPRSFSNLVHLQRLHLDHLPELRVVEAQAFHTLPALKELQLHENSRFAYLDPKALTGTPSLKRLMLHDNALRTVAASLMAGLPPGASVSLHGNPLLCDCNVRWLRNLLQNQESANPLNASLIVEEGEHVTCASPERARHKLVRDVGPQQVGKRCAPTLLDVTWGSEPQEGDLRVEAGGDDTKTTEPRVIERRVGDELILECRALGEPEPRLRWNLPRNMSANAVHEAELAHLTAPGTLVIPHVMAADSGMYSCAAENALGSAKVSWIVSVVPLDLHLFASASSATFITLVWNGTQRHAFPRYVIRYVAVGDDNGDPESTTWVSPFRRSYTVAPLLPATRYRFCLVFRDGSGSHSPLSPSHHTDQWTLTLACTEARTQDPSFLAQGISRPPATAALMALGAVLLLAVTIALSCAGLALLRRIRKRGRYLCPPQSSCLSSHPTPHAAHAQGHTLYHRRAPHIPMDSLKSPLIGTASSSSS